VIETRPCPSESLSRDEVVDSIASVEAVPHLERRTALVKHIVLFRWTEEASQAAIDSAVAELRGLAGKIAGIVDLSCGTNFSERAKGFTHGLVVQFTDRAALEAYGPHPEHQRVLRNFLNPIRADILVFDYQF
jgi:hypothetical protein